MFEERGVEEIASEFGIDLDNVPEPSEEDVERANAETEQRLEALEQARKALDTYSARFAAESVRDYLVAAFCDVEHGLGNSFMEVVETENGWQLKWPQGPTDWAVLLAGGDSIFSAELGHYGDSSELDVSRGHVHVEPQHGTALNFYDA
jgi:hypothetical protein